MKNSKIVLFLAAFVVGITGCEVESEKHEHTFFCRDFDRRIFSI